MQHLTNNCRVGKISVYPQNWKTISANKNLIWKIWYHFYDDNLQKIKKVVIKGMNNIENLKQKQEYLQIVLTDEIEALKKGYNPITKRYQAEINPDDISPDIPFSKALELAHKDLQVVHQFWIDIKSTIKYVNQSAKALQYDSIPVKDIRRKHIKKILDHCAKVKDTWSANTFNAYRRDLRMLFKQLLQYDAVEFNPVRDIDKQKTIRKIKKILTPEECQLIDQWVKKYDRRFWLLIHIFFHSGARTTEMFRVKFEHVNLKKQTVLYTVLKGNQPFEVERPIKDIAIDFWKEAIKDGRPGDYVFSKGLSPGTEPVSPRQATIRWHRHIKGDKKNGKLGIDSSWYGLKYLNSDQIAEEKGLRIAAKLNSHKSINTTKLYAVNNEARDMEEIKSMKNPFG